MANNQEANQKLFNQLNEYLQKLEAQFDYRMNETFVKATEEIKRSANKVNFDLF